MMFSRTMYVTKKASFNEAFFYLRYFVCPTRIERVTPSLEGWCSIQLSYGHIEIELKRAVLDLSSYLTTMFLWSHGYILVTYCIALNPLVTIVVTGWYHQFEDTIVATCLHEPKLQKASMTGKESSTGNIVA